MLSSFIRLLVFFFVSEPVLGLPAFKIVLNGNTSYLVGTMHQRFQPSILPPSLFSLISQSEETYFETDLADISLQQQERLLRDMDQGEKAGRALQNLFNKTEWLSLKRIMPSFGIPAEVFNVLSPGVAYEQALVAFEILDSTYVANRSAEVLKRNFELVESAKYRANIFNQILSGGDDLDSLLKRRAHSFGKPIHALDLESQYLKDVSYAELKEFVRWRLKRLSKIRSTPEDKFKAYVIKKLNDVAEWERYLTWTPESPLPIGADVEPWEQKNEGRRALRSLVERHRKWWSVLKPAFEKGNVFVAVGVDHVLSEDGNSLIDFLNREGADVEFLELVRCQDWLDP
jgi:uncharacterized protein YbaP (TraB family)